MSTEAGSHGFITLCLLSPASLFMKRPPHAVTHLWTANASLDPGSSVLPPYRKSSRCHGSSMRCLRLERAETEKNKVI